MNMICHIRKAITYTILVGVFNFYSHISRAQWPETCSFKRLCIFTPPPGGKSGGKVYINNPGKGKIYIYIYSHNRNVNLGKALMQHAQKSYLRQKKRTKTSAQG